MERRTTAVIAGTVALVAGGTIAYQISRHETKPKSERGSAVIRRATSVKAGAHELYEMWRNPETLQQLLGENVHVEPLGEQLCWTMPAANVSWTTRILEDRPGEFMRWESASDDPVRMEAALSFRPAPADWGTEVHLEYHLATPAPLRRIVELIGDLFGYAMLRRMKSLAETGVIPTLEHNPAHRDGGLDE
jgi:uncharacterized membrane protein